MKVITIKNIQGWFVGKGLHGWSLFLSLIATILLSCATPAKRKPLPEPNIPKASSGHDLLVILGMNDFHGALMPLEKKTDPTPKVRSVTYEVGGASIFASHVKTLRRQFGNQLLLLDAGDQWQGTLDSNLEEGAPVVEFYNRIGVDVATLGNHEFDFGPLGPDAVLSQSPSADPLGAMKKRLQEAKFPYVAANVHELSTGKLLKTPNLFSSVIVQKSGVSVGVLGLTTLHTPNSTRSQFVTGLRFQDLKKSALTEVERLRNSGAKVIVLTAHVGLVCRDQSGTIQNAKFNVWDIKTPQGPCERSPNRQVTSPSHSHELTELLESLPKGTFDAVIAGHSHQIIHHWINGTPVIQSGASGLYYQLLYLHLDRSTKKIIPELTQIEGPIPVCTKVFENQNDCNGKEPAPPEGRGNLVAYELHGTPIYKDPEIESFLLQVGESTLPAKQRIVGESIDFLPHTRTQESAIGNLAADSLRDAANTDFALVNPGGIRAALEKGAISYESVFRSFPFDNFVSRLEVTGRELKSILRVAFNGSRGVFSVSGLRIKVIPADQPAKEIKDFDGDGKIAHWEAIRLLNVTDENGKKIADNKKYTLATLDFLVLGGDDMLWPMSKIPRSRITMDAAGLYRDVVAGFIEKRKTVSTSLYDPRSPRIVYGRSI